MPVDPNVTTPPQPTPHGSAHEGSPAVLAHYRSLPEVRDAIETLEASGVDGDDLALVGKAAVDLEGSTPRTRSDRRFLSNASAQIALGMGAGGLLAALIGAAFVGAIVLVADVAHGGWVFLLVTAWFAAGGCLLGMFYGVSRSAGFSESMPLTYADEPGEPLWLAVYAESAERVLPAVARTAPIEIVDEPDLVTTHPAMTGRAA
ncbi:MAG TPA: hypothetical protein VH986_14975 [Acidimicrobiia bacterium]